MKELKSDLLVNEFNKIVYDDNFNFTAPCKFKAITSVDDEVTHVEQIKFQDGAIIEHGINGFINEELIAMIICRLEHYEKSEFECVENKRAISDLKSALYWLNMRTAKRKRRGVKGYYIK